MGKHHRSPTKQQNSATGSVQQLRGVVTKIFTDNWTQESTTQLKQWLVKYLPAYPSSGTSAWKEMRDYICLDQKLLEKLCCVFQDARENALILLMSQLFGELMSSKRTAKLLVQCGLTLAVLCQIRICCSLASSNNQTNNPGNASNSNSSGSSWQSVPSTSSNATNVPSSDTIVAFTAPLSMQCSFLGSSSATDLAEKQQPPTSVTTSSTSNSNGGTGENARGSGVGGLQCSPQLAIALHQLACRIFPLDPRYNAKARATGAIIGTLLAAKALFLDKKALFTFLCCLRFYLNSSKNLKLLGTNGCVSLLHRLVGSLLPPRQTRLLKLAVDLLSSLLKSPSNCVRFVQSGGVNTLMTAFENVHRTDSRCRQLQVRRIILRCLLMVSQVRGGRTAIIQSGAIHTLYTISKELPSRQELDGMFLTAMGIIKNTAGPRRLPVSNLHSPYSFGAPQQYQTSELTRTATKIGLPAVGHARRAVVPQTTSTASGTQNPNAQRQQHPSTDDESASPLEESDDDYAEDTDFVIRNFLRNDSTDERVDGGVITGGDDSDSDDNMVNTSAQDVTAAMAAVPLESDPVVLASYDMFFPEVRDLALLNPALSDCFVLNENGTGVPPGVPNNNVSNFGGAVGGNVLDNDFITDLNLRTAAANASVNANSSTNSQQATTINVLASPSQRKLSNAGQLRKATGKTAVLTRRSSELNVGSSTTTDQSSPPYGFVVNSVVNPSPGDGRISSFLPLSLVGEHVTNAAAERSGGGGGGGGGGGNGNNNSGNSLNGFAANRDAARYAKLYNSVKRLAIWNKIPFPCLHGFMTFPSPEPQLTMPSVNIRRLVLADVDRFMQKMPTDLINEVVYDLDAIIANSPSTGDGQSGPSSRSNSTTAGRASTQQQQGPPTLPPLGNDDLQRIGRPSLNGENGLQFNSLFECGNLRRAVRIRENEYDLILTPDVSTNHHLQWFYFEVNNTPPAYQAIRFNILNCEKPKSQYEKGMQILQFSVTEAALGRPAWRRVGYDICYYKGYHEHPSGPLPLVSYYTMTFTVEFPHSYDVVYFAYHYPFSYSLLLYELEAIQNRVLPPDVYYTCQTLCTSEMSNAVPLITITSNSSNVNPTNSSSTLPGISNAQQSLPTVNSNSNNQSIVITSLTTTPQNSSSSSSNTGPFYRTQQQRPYIFITSRVHAGETNSSWMMRGVIAFLLGDTPSARRARQSFVFKIVPMLNVDGTVNGNHRCSLFGDDLNRSWTRPSPVLAPAIFHSKRLLAWLRFRRRPILCYIDFHGHSRKKNVFVLGCSPSQSWRRRDTANPAIDPITGEEDTRWKLLPVLLAATSPTFSIQDCCFMIERAKEPTGRVVCWRQVGLIAAYTLEATFCGFDQGTHRGLQVTPVHLQEMGADLCRCFEPLFASMGRCPMPHARYGEGLTQATQQNNNAMLSPTVNVMNAPTSSSNFPAAPTSTRLSVPLRSITLADDSSTSSSSSSSEGGVVGVNDDPSDDDVIEEPLTRRNTVVASKNLTFISKKF